MNRTILGGDYYGNLKHETSTATRNNNFFLFSDQPYRSPKFRMNRETKNKCPKSFNCISEKALPKAREILAL
jgi:hypothetical protein